MSEVEDYSPRLKAAIAEAKAAGLEEAAAELEGRLFAAYTTSSELIGEHGVAIREFLKSGGAAVPPGVRASLEGYLKHIGGMSSTRIFVFRLAVVVVLVAAIAAIAYLLTDSRIALRILWIAGPVALTAVCFAVLQALLPHDRR
jgi:hypothetical protein